MKVKMQIYRVCDLCQGQKVIYLGESKIGCSKCVRNNIVTGKLETDMFIEVDTKVLHDMILEDKRNSEDRGKVFIR